MAKRFAVCAHWMATYALEGHTAQRRFTAHVIRHVAPSSDKHCLLRCAVIAFWDGCFREDKTGSVCTM
jgi:hypothetical protein